MKLKVILAALIVLPLTLTACTKKDKAADAQTAASTTVTETNTVSPEQQAAIDAIDKPVLDEKNTDVPAEKANAPADPATPATE